MVRMAVLEDSLRVALSNIARLYQADGNNGSGADRRVSAAVK